MRLRREYVKDPSPLPPGGGRAISQDELLSPRDGRAREFAELQFDLGGLAYEIAIRDHFRVDLLARRAARLQEFDAKLGAVERLARFDGGGAPARPDCDALFPRGRCSACSARTR